MGIPHPFQSICIACFPLYFFINIIIHFWPSLSINYGMPSVICGLFGIFPPLWWCGSSELPGTGGASGSCSLRSGGISFCGDCAHALWHPLPFVPAHRLFFFFHLCPQSPPTFGVSGLCRRLTSLRHVTRWRQMPHRPRNPYWRAFTHRCILYTGMWLSLFRFYTDLQATPFLPYIQNHCDWLLSIPLPPLDYLNIGLCSISLLHCQGDHPRDMDLWRFVWKEVRNNTFLSPLFSFPIYYLFMLITPQYLLCAPHTFLHTLALVWLPFSRTLCLSVSLLFI